MPRPMMARPASPPTTAPAMVPAPGEEEPWVWGSGVVAGELEVLVILVVEVGPEVEGEVVIGEEVTEEEDVNV